MTIKEGRPGPVDLKQVLADDPDLLRPLVQSLVQEALEAEMTAVLGAAKGERTADRRGYRSGYYERGLVTRVGKLELRVPQDRDGHFSTELFERYQRSEKALVAALAEMYVQGSIGRGTRSIDPEGQGGHRGALRARLLRLVDQPDQQAPGRRARPLRGPTARRALPLPDPGRPLREGARGSIGSLARSIVIRSQAVLEAIGIDWEGRRQVLGVELAKRESRSSWKGLLLGLKTRGPAGVEFVVADDHAGLRRAIEEVLAEAAWQRC